MSNLFVQCQISHLPGEQTITEKVLRIGGCGRGYNCKASLRGYYEIPQGGGVWITILILAE